MKNYKKPPIVEAALCIYIEPSAKKIGAKELEDACRTISKKYPTSSLRRRFQNVFKMDTDGKCKSENTDLGLDGYICKSADEKEVVQLCLDRFVFNQLAPYKGWEAFFSEAIAMWESYRDVMEPMSIKKISLRNINRIDMLTQKQEELGKYLLLAPQVPTGISANIKEFAHETVFTVKENIQVNLIQVSRSVDSGIPSIFLDIDVSLPIKKAIGKEEIIFFLNELREAKNQVFESCLTDSVKRGFE